MTAKQLTVEVSKVEKIKADVFLLSFVSSYLAKASHPGNFLHVKIKSAILRRPFSVHKVLGDKIYILFRVRGRGTDALCRYKKGEKLDVIGPLGKGFDIGRQLSAVSCQLSAVRRQRIEDRGQRVEVQNILVGGGIGVAPLVFLGQQLSPLCSAHPKQRNIALLGFKSRTDVLCQQEFEKLGFKVYVATEDGSKGVKGTVIGPLERSLWTREPGVWINLYCCGSKEMFWRINQILEERSDVRCQVSFEQFMGCGLGVCCGCAIETKKGYKKVCNDGPVFDIRDIW